MNYEIKYFKENFEKSNFSFFVLGADVGGTNTNLCIAGIKDLKPILLYSLTFNSNDLDSISPAINEVLNFSRENYDITVKNGCIGAAGIIAFDKKKAELTNVDWNIKIEEIKKQTTLNRINIINDFQAIGYGINFLDPNTSKDLVVIRPEKGKALNQQKAIVGAGTGLGKSILVYDKQLDVYIPIPSEGGHADFPVTNDFEYEMVEFIKKFRQISPPLPYEELLSGRGIESIYQFLKNDNKFVETRYTKEIDSSENKAENISKYRMVDTTCKNTFNYFTKFYARCAKNFVLDSLSLGGLYIAGGIALKNKEIFHSKEFIEEFENGYRRSSLLRKIPIYVITNYDVSLFGTCYACLDFLD